MPWQAILGSEKATRELGWMPTPVRTGFRATIAFLNQERLTAKTP